MKLTIKQIRRVLVRGLSSSPENSPGVGWDAAHEHLIDVFNEIERGVRELNGNPK